jgi:agmatinase
MALFDDELSQETYRIGIHTMDALEVENLEPAAMVEKICASTLEVLKANKFPVMLGGEHLISVGAVKAFKEIYPNLSVLQLDAHCGLRNEHMGSRLNEACVARRLSEICPLVQVGVRSLSKEEKDYLAAETNGREVKAISVYDILDTPMWKDKVVNSLSENVYVTIDLAVFDPSVMPAVGTPEPGGMGWYEAIDLLKEVSKDRKVAGFDVVGLCPIENQSAPDFFASKLIYRFLGYIFSGKK